jgi:hypothetical protein
VQGLVGMVPWSGSIDQGMFEKSDYPRHDRAQVN